MKTSLILRNLAVILCVAGFIFVGFLFREKKSDILRVQAFSGLACDEPIPIGKALNDIVDIMNDAFVVYRNNNLDFAINNIQALVSALGANKDVCDFSRCSPQIENEGGKAVIILDAYVRSWEIGMEPFPPGMCEMKECTGDICPNVQQHIKGRAGAQGMIGLETLISVFDTSADMIHGIFGTKNIPLPEDLLREGEKAGILVTKADILERQVEKVKGWLSPSTGKNCMPSNLDRKLIADGRMGNRYPIRCVESLEDGSYWPKMWSQECSYECEKRTEEDCIKCLKKSPDAKSSILAKINFRVYNKCESDCKNPLGQWELTDDCYGCLCKEPAKAVAGSGGVTGGAEITLTAEECTAWLCGGDIDNWICCHETSIDEIIERPTFN